MSEPFTIHIDMDKKCAECGKGGAMPSQICLRCTTKAITGKRMKSWQGRAVAKRFTESNAARDESKQK